MRKFIKKFLRISVPASAVAIIAVLVFAVPNTAGAASPLGILLGGVLKTVNSVIGVVLNTVVDVIGYGLITIAGTLVNFAFGFDRFVEASIVQIGWTVVRDMANMLFILIMLAVAFSTILQFQTYGFKKIIPKLVIVALTINFSLLICGVIIDFGNSVSQFFINSVAPTGEVGTGIMKAADAGRLAQIRNQTDNTNAMLASIAMQLIFYIILAFVLLAIAIVMLFRIVMLWILIIVAPAAWVGSIINPGSFKKWWSKFINLAVIFPIVMSFFIFLSFVMATLFKRSGGMFQNVSSSESAWDWIFPSTSLQVILQFLAVMAFLGYGLSQAGKSGTAGGAMVVKWAGQGKKWAMGQMKAAPAGIGKTAVRLADKRIEKRTGVGGVATRGMVRGIEKLEKMPLIGRALGGPGKYFKDQQAKLKKDAGKFSGLRPKDLEEYLKRKHLTPEGFAEDAAVLKALVDQGKFSIDDPEKGIDWIKKLQIGQNNGFSIMDLLKKRTDLLENAEIQKMIMQDMNIPQPVKNKLQNAIVQTNAVNEYRETDKYDEDKARKQEIAEEIHLLEASGQKDAAESMREELERLQAKENTGVDAFRTLVREEIIKTSSDAAGIQQEAFDRSRNILPEKKDEYNRLEGYKDRAAGTRSEERDRYEEQTEKLIKSIERLEKSKDPKDNEEAQRQSARLEILQKEENRAIETYMRKIQDIETQQLNLSKRFGADIMLKFVSNELMKKGTLDVSALGTMKSKNPAAYIRVVKYLRTHEELRGKLKRQVEEHIDAGVFAQTIQEEEAAKATSSTSTPAPATPTTPTT